MPYVGEELLSTTLFSTLFSPLSHLSPHPFATPPRRLHAPALWGLEDLPSVSIRDGGDGDVVHLVVLLGLSLVGCLWYYPRLLYKDDEDEPFLGPLPRVFMGLNDSECVVNPEKLRDLHFKLVN